jgi:Sec-independent protein secretion pathway component TatC
MEQDRYQKNHILFVIGLFSLVVCLSLFALSFYIMPNLLFGWHYDAPLFIVNVVEWMQYTYNYTATGASKTVFFVVFFLALFFAGIAYFCSNRIDDQIYSSELQSKKKPKILQDGSKDDGLRLALKILFFTMLIFAAGALFEWFIYTPPQSEQFTTNTN